ncbi:DUF3891 family protein [Bacillus sp. SG-1]|uniref:DUF3891 family protein n=1 Tax=Bacillus sp. SG-1 TaxID=161544 RepID=UPI0002E251A9|nr:DUF3891 family protein [Bacillus sp. SG-1]
MIIRENNDSFIMITQHDHAFLSGEITRQLNRSLLKSDSYFNDAVYAAREHDRGWIGLDETPIWNDQADAPYTFSDYPLLPKLAFYKIGLHEIESMNPYAALLCSMHFCSFFSQSKDPDGIHFIHEETKRQKKIKQNTPELDQQLLHQHFALLQFSDNLSLYLCLNDPGVEKQDEHPWFRNGFKNTQLFHPKQKLLKAHWKSQDEVIIESFPFMKDFELALPYKKVSKNFKKELGIAEAYKKAEAVQKTIIISEA